MHRRRTFFLLRHLFVEELLHLFPVRERNRLVARRQQFDVDAEKAERCQTFHLSKRNSCGGSREPLPNPEGTPQGRRRV